MYKFEHIIGNSIIIDSLKGSIINDLVMHSYLFITQDNVMRNILINTFAKGILCENFKDDVCGKCSSCTSMEGHNNPDIIYLNPLEGKNTISVIQVKEMVKDIDIKPYKNKFKIYIIEESDLLTEEAQNALLKTLEEPCQHAKILLGANTEQSILPTILSRCIKLKIMPLSKESLKKMNEAFECNIKEDDKNSDFYINYAQGSLTNLKDISTDELFIEKRNEIINITEKLVSKSVLDFLEVKEYILDNEDNIKLILDILEIWYRDLLMIKNNIETDIINLDKINTLKRQEKNISERTIDIIFENIRTFRRYLERNVNFKLMTEVFQINIREEDLKEGVS